MFTVNGLSIFGLVIVNISIKTLNKQKWNETTWAKMIWLKWPCEWLNALIRHYINHDGEIKCDFVFLDCISLWLVKFTIFEAKKKIEWGASVKRNCLLRFWLPYKKKDSRENNKNNISLGILLYINSMDILDGKKTPNKCRFVRSKQKPFHSVKMCGQKCPIHFALVNSLRIFIFFVCGKLTAVSSVSHLMYDFCHFW